MQKFKIVTEEIGEEIKRFKKERSDDLQEIKQLCENLQQKQKAPFAPTVERIAKNLTFFKESEYKSAHAGINTAEIVQKYQTKMKKINDQISKLDKIIKNGCGNIVEKSLSSRLSVPGTASERKEMSQIEMNQSNMDNRDHQK